MVQHRQGLLAAWSSLAQDCLERSDLPDAPLRRLLRGVPDGAPAQMGKTCNIDYLNPKAM